MAGGGLRRGARTRASTSPARPCSRWATAAATPPRRSRCRWWRAGEEAAGKIGFARALEGAIELTREQYEQRHDGDAVEVAYEPSGEFVVERVGQRTKGDFQDIGVEYYRYVPDATAIADAPNE